MKLVMTLLVRDEVDVIRENIEYHLARGVDHVIATDNDSTDGTPDILREYEKSGVLTLLRETGTDFRQMAWVTKMSLLARDKFGANWILNNDADEFWRPRSGNIKDAILAAEKSSIARPAILVCRRLNMVASWQTLDSTPWLDALVFRVRTQAANGLPV
jgi:hypothetical protein